MERQQPQASSHTPRREQAHKIQLGRQPLGCQAQEQHPNHKSGRCRPLQAMLPAGRSLPARRVHQKQSQGSGKGHGHDEVNDVMLANRQGGPGRAQHKQGSGNKQPLAPQGRAQHENPDGT